MPNAVPVEADSPPPSHDGPGSRARRSGQAGREPVWWVTIRVLDMFMRLAGRLDLRGTENIPDGPALLVANHVSWLDPIALIVAVHRATGRRLRFVVMPSLFRAPVVGWFLAAGRHIPAHDGAQARTTLAAVLAALEAGELVLVYPEGGIPRLPHTAPARPGVGVLLRRAKAPVVPVATAGLERRRRWYAGRRHARLLVGLPLDTDPRGPLRGSRPADAAEHALASVRALLPCVAASGPVSTSSPTAPTSSLAI